MVTIKNWLESADKDYETGLVLLAKNSKNRVLIQNLNRKQNSDKLEYELKKIARISGTKVVKPKDEKSVDDPKKPSDKLVTDTEAIPGPNRTKIIRNDHAIKYEDCPQHIRERWDENRDSYKEIRSTHEKLKLMEKATPEDRKPLISRIDQLDKIIHANWEFIDNWDPDKETKTTSPGNLDHKRINSNRKFISSNIKRLALVKNPQKSDKIKKELAKRVKELLDAGEKISPETLEELNKLQVKLD